MKQRSEIIIIWLLVLGIGVVVLSHERRIQVIEDYPPSNEPGAEISPMEAPAQYTFNDLLDAIEWVESKGDPWAVGDGGAAVGAYQIHKIYVDDVNRICAFHCLDPILTYEDGLDRDTSRAMVNLYLSYYGRSWFTADQMHYFEYCARIHNGGPNGWDKESTKAYWLRVKARMEAK